VSNRLAFMGLALTLFTPIAECQSNPDTEGPSVAAIGEA
jgi:hypothetical protein